MRAAIQRCYQERERLFRYGGSRNENALKPAFIAFVNEFAGPQKRELVDPLKSGDGILKNILRLDHGYRQAQDQDDDENWQRTTDNDEKSATTKDVNHLSLISRNNFEYAKK